MTDAFANVPSSLYHRDRNHSHGRLCPITPTGKSDNYGA